MATPIQPNEPSTKDQLANPNSLTNLTKTIDEQKKQTLSDTKFDTKGQLYETFADYPSKEKIMSIGLSFLIAAGVLMVAGAFLPKARRR